MAGVDLAAGGCLRSVRADLKRGRGDDTDAAPPRAKRQQAEVRCWEQGADGSKKLKAQRLATHLLISDASDFPQLLTHLTALNLATAPQVRAPQGASWLRRRSF